MKIKVAAGLLGMAFWSVSALAQPFSLGLFGDTGYSRGELALVPDLIAEMDREDLAFVIHDGDFKSGGSVCSDEVFRHMLQVFEASRHPLIYVPGDNEWTDCHRKNNGAYDPVERLAKLREMFFSGATALGQRPLKLQRQSADPKFAAYRENVRWETNGVIFVGMNVTGSQNNFHGASRNGGPVEEFLQRSVANKAWLAQAFERARQAKLAGLMLVIQANPLLEVFNEGKPVPGYTDFLTQLRVETLAFPGQVVLVHGDSHQQQINQPLRDPATQAVIRNFTRVETYGSPNMGWIKTTVDAKDAQVFRFEARPFRLPIAQP